jgi:fluoroquinolone transport system ATP-binding protein
MILELKKEGKTIFMTTHNMTVAEQLCERVAFIVDGNIPVIDSPKELMVKYGTQNIKID